MNSEINYKSFGNSKSINEILHTIKCWNFDLKFTKSEINFILKLIENYPFNSIIPNLYERIQLFSKDLINIENERNKLLIEIENYRKDLIGQEEQHHFETHDYYLIEFHHTAELVFEYHKKLKKLKGTVFEYVMGIMESNLKNEKELT